jgi:hypothetical protein
MPSAALDLGPIVGDSPSQLLAEADRLHADGLVEEGRSLREIYGTIDWHNSTLSQVNRVAAAIISSFTRGGGAASEGDPFIRLSKNYYRAFRLGASPRAALLHPSASVPADAAAQLSALTTLSQQLAVAHALLANDDFSWAAYQRLRAALLQ